MEIQFDENSLLDIARKSESGNAVIPFSDLTKKQKNAVKTLLGLSGKDEGQIHFGIEDEAVLNVIKRVEGVFVSIVTPQNNMGEHYLYN